PVPRLGDRDLLRGPALRARDHGRVPGAHPLPHHVAPGLRRARLDRGKRRQRVSYRIPYNRVTLTGQELPYIREAVERGHLSGDGSFTKRCHEILQRELGVPRVLLTTNCTHALEMAALLLDLQPGDEVIVPSFAFVTTVNAFVLHGATPVFADVRADTLN